MNCRYRIRVPCLYERATRLAFLVVLSDKAKHDYAYTRFIRLAGSIHVISGSASMGYQANNVFRLDLK
jgi:hypothetical protein